MTMQQIEAKGLASISIQSAGPEVAVMVLTDTSGFSARFALNPEALSATLLPLLELATQWADNPSTQIANVAGSQSALPATHIDIAQGRNGEECALRVFVGKTEICFLSPLSVVVGLCANLARSIELKPPMTPH